VRAMFAEMIALALVHREGEEEPVARGSELGHAGDQAEIGISLGKIELAQQIAVVGEAVGS